MVLFELFLGIALFTPTIHAAAQPAGKVVSVSGKVLLRNEDQSGAQVQLKVGDSIGTGDVINTASDSSAKLLMADKTILDLAGSTLFKVNEYTMNSGPDRNVSMTMNYGKVRAAVNTPVTGKGKFIIRTKAATMGVRGTEFIIASELKAAEKPVDTGPTIQTRKLGSAPPASQETTTQITVIKGKVDVTDNAKPQAPAISVTQGKQLITMANLSGDNLVPKMSSGGKTEAPKMVDLNQGQLKTMVSETKIQDQTFKQVVVVDNNTSNNSNPIAPSSTMTAVAATVSTQPAFVPSPSEMNTPGTFTPTTNIMPTNTVQPGAPVTIQVVFKK